MAIALLHDARVPEHEPLSGGSMLAAIAGAQPRRRPPRRARVARLERPFALAGLALVALHFADSALAGPDTTVAGLAGIVFAAAVAAALQPHVARLTRFALAVSLGLAFAITGALAYVLDLFTSGPRWTDLTGVGYALGGVLLVAAGIAALAAPRHVSRRRGAARVARGVGWVLGAVVVAQLVVVPLVTVAITTTAPRFGVDDGALAVAHQTVRLPARGGDLSAWYIPSRNGAAVLVVHGSGSDRSHVAKQAELVARRGYGVLALDLPGHGESDGRASRLGDNAQPAIRAALDWLARRPGIDPHRIAGFGMSLGGEVLLEAAARDSRLRAVISDGAERASDDRELRVGSGLARTMSAIGLAAVRGVSGMREAPPLVGLVGRIAPRPVLLIAGGGRGDEIGVNRAYRHAAGPGAQLWTLPEASHTDGINARPREYAHRVTAFLDRALAGGT